jgi:cell wall assembly regulator SMI1
MKELWDRIEAWFRGNVPPDYYSFADGATELQIREAEAKLKIRLPTNLRNSYLVHNGSDWKGIFGYHYLASLDELVHQSTMMRDVVAAGYCEGYNSTPSGPIKPMCWNTLWLPFAITGAGDCICVDMDPAVGGNLGQVIETNHEIGPVKVLAIGFREWLSEFAYALEAGDFESDEQLEMIRRVGQQ